MYRQSSSLKVDVLSNIVQSKWHNTRFFFLPLVIVSGKKHFTNSKGKFVNFPEAANQSCSLEKLFWKYAANLQENTHAEVWFQ